MITRGFGFDNHIISRGFGLLKQKVVEIIKLISYFYKDIILNTLFPPAEIINLKSDFSFNIYLKSVISLTSDEKILLNTKFNKDIFLKSDIKKV